jgi:hypothetical protein
VTDLQQPQVITTYLCEFCTSLAFAPNDSFLAVDSMKEGLLILRPKQPK